MQAVDEGSQLRIGLLLLLLNLDQKLHAGPDENPNCFDLPLVFVESSFSLLAETIPIGCKLRLLPL